LHINVECFIMDKNIENSDNEMLCIHMKNCFIKIIITEYGKNQSIEESLNIFLKESNNFGWDIKQIRQCICQQDFFNLFKEHIDDEIIEALSILCKSI